MSQDFHSTLPSWTGRTARAHYLTRPLKSAGDGPEGVRNVPSGKTEGSVLTSLETSKQDFFADCSPCVLGSRRGNILGKGLALELGHSRDQNMMALRAPR